MGKIHLLPLPWRPAHMIFLGSLSLLASGEPIELKLSEGNLWQLQLRQYISHDKTGRVLCIELAVCGRLMNACGRLMSPIDSAWSGPIAKNVVLFGVLAHTCRAFRLRDKSALRRQLLAKVFTLSAATEDEGTSWLAQMRDDQKVLGTKEKSE